MSKPKVPAGLKKKLKERSGQVEIKFGFVQATSIKLDEDDWEAIVNFFSTEDMEKEYFKMETMDKHGTPLVACVVATLPKPPEDEQFHFEDWNWYKNKDKADADKKIPEDDRQSFRQSVKCEPAPNSNLAVWYSKKQAEPLAFDSVYIYVGILQVQWNYKDAEGKKHYVDSKEEIPANTKFYELHILNFVDYLDLN